MEANSITQETRVYYDVMTSNGVYSRTVFSCENLIEAQKYYRLNPSQYSNLALIKIWECNTEVEFAEILQEFNSK